MAFLITKLWRSQGVPLEKHQPQPWQLIVMDSLDPQRNFMTQESARSGYHSNLVVNQLQHNVLGINDDMEKLAECHCSGWQDVGLQARGSKQTLFDMEVCHHGSYRN